jgi:hypothetical protein
VALLLPGRQRAALLRPLRTVRPLRTGCRCAPRPAQRPLLAAAAAKWTVSDNERLTWPAGRHSLCGEPHNDAHRYMRPGPIQGGWLGGWAGWAGAPAPASSPSPGASEARLPRQAALVPGPGSPLAAPGCSLGAVHACTQAQRTGRPPTAALPPLPQPRSSRATSSPST